MESNTSEKKYATIVAVRRDTGEIQVEAIVDGVRGLYDIDNLPEFSEKDQYWLEGVINFFIFLDTGVQEPLSDSVYCLNQQM